MFKSGCYFVRSSSDHLPLSILINVQVQSVPSAFIISSSSRVKIIYNCNNADTTKLTYFGIANTFPVTNIW